MMLSGNLSDWSVGDLLQMLHITKKTASLHIDGVDRSGVVYFDEGSIVNAGVSLGGGPKKDPRDEVVEAVYVLELLDGGSFEIKNEVPPRTIEPLAVAEALELAGQHLDAERHLDETGLLAARGLRLAPTIEEPIILSEQVWSAISVSIPAFTFPELEERLGRADAVSTVEQFRDLGILEAVLEDVEPSLSPPQDQQSPVESGFGDLVEASDDEVDSQLAEAFADAWAPPASEPADDSWTPPVAEASDESWTPSADDGSWTPSVDDGSWTPPTPEPDTDYVPASEADEAAASHPEAIVPHNTEEVTPITSNAPDDSIVVAEEPTDAPVEPVSSGLTPGASSLSAAIRAAAGARSATPSDDEAKLLSEAASGGHPEDGDLPEAEDGSLRRTVKSLVSPSSEQSPSRGLGDLSARFRQAAADQED